jgi:hypothetical protein
VSDEIDQAQELSQDFVERAIEANRRTQHKLVPRGKCFNCDEVVEGSRLFCEGDDCREDWEFRISRIKGHQVFSGAS